MIVDLWEIFVVIEHYLGPYLWWNHGLLSFPTFIKTSCHCIWPWLTHFHIWSEHPGFYEVTGIYILVMQFQESQCHSRFFRTTTPPTPQRKTVYSLWSLFLHWYVFLRNVLPFFPPFFPFPSHLMSNCCFWHHNGNLGPDSWYCATFCLCRCWRSWIWYEKMMLIVY